jgi:hypothetical protein
MSLSELRDQLGALQLSCQPEQRRVLREDPSIDQECVSLAGPGASGRLDLSYSPQAVASPKYIGILCGLDPVVFGANFSVTTPSVLVDQVMRLTGGKLGCSG